jgi:hypothetical protein
MSGLFAGAIQDNDAIYRNGLDYVELPWQDALAAHVKDSFIHNPIPEVGAFSELETAQHPAVRSFFKDMMTNMASEGDANPQPLRDALDQADQRDIASGADNFIDPHTLNQKYGKSLGLSFDKPERAGAVAIMVRRRQEQLDTDAKLAHAPAGLVFGGTSLLTSLAVGATDPLNVAASFVPVVGETRAGLWAERFGKFGARALEGGIEGGVGQALLETINIATETAYHNNYGPMDSFLNVAFGTLLGGGLHTGFGAISDLMGRMSPETREQTLRTAVAQMAEGRDVQVDHVIYSDPTFRQLDQMPVLRDLHLASDEARITGEHAQGTADLKALPAGDPAAREKLAQLQAIESQLQDPEIQAEVKRILGTRRDEILTDTTPEKLQAGAKPFEDRRNLENRLSSLESDLANVRSQRLSLKVQDTLTPPHMRAIADTMAQRVQRVGEAAPEAARQAAPQFASEADTTARQAIDKARSDTLAASQGQGAPISGRPFTETEQAVREAGGDDLATELQEANTRLAAYEKQGVLTPEEIEHARAADVVETANQRSKAADAAAICLNLHP